VAKQPGIVKTTPECWQQYPKLKFPQNLTKGAAQKRARDACVAASMRGEPDPELISGPPILKRPKALWGVKAPYTKRPVDKAGNTAKVIGRITTLGISSLKGGGDTLRTIAVGWRPPVGPGTSRFGEVETNGTILGGIDTLIAAGIQPWPAFAVRVQKLPQQQLQGSEGLDMPLLGLVKDGAVASGDAPPKTLKKAAEYIRSTVKDNDLAAAAWHARAVRIAYVGQSAQKKAQAVSSAVSLGTSTAGWGLVAASAPVAASVIGLPVAAVMVAVGGAMKGIGLAVSAAGTVTGAQEARNKSLIEERQMLFAHEMEMRNIRIQARSLEQQLAASQNQSWLQEGEQLGQIIQVSAWVGVLGLTALGAYLVFSRKQDK